MPHVSHVDQILRKLAAEAIRKNRAGQRPTAQELAALRKVERQQEEERRWQYYRTVPKQHYLMMAGDGEKPRANKVVNEQADRYGLPLRGKTLDLSHVLRSFHDFLARNKHRLAKGDSEGDALSGQGESPDQKRLHKAKADMAEMDRDERRATLISADRLREICIDVGGVLKSARRRLVKKFGRDAGKMLDEGLRDLDAITARECDADKS